MIDAGRAQPGRGDGSFCAEDARKAPLEVWRGHVGKRGAHGREEHHLVGGQRARGVVAAERVGHRAASLAQLRRERPLQCGRRTVPQLVERRQAAVDERRQRGVRHECVRWASVGRRVVVALAGGHPAGGGRHGGQRHPAVRLQRVLEGSRRGGDAVYEHCPGARLKGRRQQAAEVKPDAPQTHAAVHAVLKHAGQRAAILDQRQQSAHFLQVRVNAPRGPAQQQGVAAERLAPPAAAALGLRRRLPLPWLRGEDSAVLHGDVEEVHAVRVGEALQEVVRRRAVQRRHLRRDERLAAAQELEAQRVLVKAAQPAQVADGAQAVGQLHGAAQARQQLLAHGARRGRYVLAQLAHHRQVAMYRGHLADERLQVERLVKAAVPHARVHQRGRLEQVQHRAVRRECCLVCLSLRDNLGRARREGLALLLQPRHRRLEGPQSRVRLLQLRPHRAHSLSGRHEACMVAHSNLLQLPAHSVGVAPQQVRLFVEPLQREAQQLAHVEVIAT
mmetsp:Transcript_22711/g.70154  ORF Transcript_22711/g.70154 Transcript_22711/m.70154 type:complete len:503 (+) Transcript_22711:217-1725(+)